jgi:hypothetical protein
MIEIIEPVICGLLVSLINRYVLNSSSCIWSSCNTQQIIIEHEDTSSSNTTINDIVDNHSI